MVTSKSVEKNNEEWYNKTVQIFERSYRTDASFVISHIKSAQKKFTCQGYLITAAKGKPLKVFSGESEAVEKQLQNSKIPYSQLITVQNNRSLQTAYIAYTKDKQKLTEALNNSGFIVIEDVDSFMSSSIFDISNKLLLNLYRHFFISTTIFGTFNSNSQLLFIF